MNVKTTHELARELLADVDCPLDWPMCRACGRRCDPDGIVKRTGAADISEGCFTFHEECWHGLSDAQLKEANKMCSDLFNGR